ncbi:MAG: hypothetical protein AAFX52_09265 [Pseudomonadota bacterium]
MTLEEFYYLSQIGAGIGVIATLVFVGIQIRQNTQALRAANYAKTTDSFNAVNLAVASHEGLGTIMARGMPSDLSALTPVERVRFDFAALSAFRIFEVLHYQQKLGLSDKELWDAERATLLELVRAPGLRVWWQENRLSFTKEFRTLMNDVVEEAQKTV